MRVCLHQDVHGYLSEDAVVRRLLQRWIPRGYVGTAFRQITVKGKVYTWVKFDLSLERDVLVPTEALRALVEPKTALERILEDECLQP